MGKNISDAVSDRCARQLRKSQNFVIGQTLPWSSHQQSSVHSVSGGLQIWCHPSWLRYAEQGDELCPLYHVPVRQPRLSHGPVGGPQPVG